MHECGAMAMGSHNPAAALNLWWRQLFNEEEKEMAREISLNEQEMTALRGDLDSGQLTGDEKVIAQIVVDKANAEQRSAKLSDPGWYFSWTYRF